MNIQSHFNVEALVTLLIDDIEKFNREFSIFEHYTILVPNASMENWLKQRIASSTKICAGINFIPLNKFLNQLTNDFGWLTEEKSKSILNKQHIATVIQSAYADIEKDHSNDLAILKDWLKEQKQPKARARLAIALADTFDIYQTFRPDWLDTWSNNKFVFNENPNEIWTAELWRLITSKVDNTFFLHRKQVSNHFSKIVERANKQIRKTYPKISVFGVNELDEQTIFQLRKLAKITPLDLYWQTPSLDFRQHDRSNILRVENREAWMEGNSLLASWGYKAREDGILLPELLSHKPVNLEDHVAPQSNTTDSLLKEIQRDIRDNTDNVDAKRPKAVDDSVTVVSHYSNSREIEGLYDFLLKRFENNPNLKPHDVLVMCPDVSRYSALIRSVFDHPFNPKKAKIPVNICGTKPAGGGIAQLLLDFLSLPHTRYKHSEILDLLFNEYVLQKLGFSKEDTHKIRQWLGSASAHWGLDETTLTQHELADYGDQYTLTKALQRIVLGLSVTDEMIATGTNTKSAQQSLESNDEVPNSHSQNLKNNLFGISGVNSLDQGLINKLVAFFRLLIECRDACIDASGNDLKRPMTSWLSFSQDVTRELVSEQLKNAKQLQQWQRLLNTLQVEIEQLPDDCRSAEVSYSTFMVQIQKLVEDYQKSLGDYYFGKVNVGSFGALKGIPAKIIAVIGLNESDFPRRNNKTDYNLFDCEVRPGDRDRTLQDKDAFLMSLLNSKDMFYASFVGLDNQNANERIPSIVLTELLDYIPVESSEKDDKGNKKIESLSPIQQPMHPFSSEFNGNFDSNIYTYRDFGLANADSSENPILKKDESKVDAFNDSLQITTVTLRELKQFFNDPANVWYKHQLNTYLPDIPEHTADEEPLESNKLAEWEFKTQLIEDAFKYDTFDNDKDEFDQAYVARTKEKMIATGKWQTEVLAQLKMDELKKDAESVFRLTKELKGAKSKQVETLEAELNISIGKNKKLSTIKLLGEVDIFKDADEYSLIHYDYKKHTSVKTKRTLSAILDSLASDLCDGLPRHEGTYFVAGENEACFKFVPLQTENRRKQSKTTLESLVQVYIDCMQQPQPVALNLELTAPLNDITNELIDWNSDAEIEDKFGQFLLNNKSVSEGGANISPALSLALNSIDSQKDAIYKNPAFMFPSLDGELPQKTNSEQLSPIQVGTWEECNVVTKTAPKGEKRND